MCERKAYPHKVCPDRNRIWLRGLATCEQDRKSIQILVNAIPIRWNFLRTESDYNYPDTCEQGLKNKRRKLRWDGPYPVRAFLVILSPGGIWYHPPLFFYQTFNQLETRYINRYD